MSNQLYHSFSSVYREWCRENTPSTTSARYTEEFPREKEMRNAFKAFLFRLGIKPVSLGYIIVPEIPVLKGRMKEQTLQGHERFALFKGGKELLINFLNHFTEPLYKDMRRGKFSPEHLKDYEEILALVVLNMQALGQPQEMIDTQVIDFWTAITEGTSCPGEFLSGLQLIYMPDEIKEISKEKYSEPDLEHFYFINQKVKEEFEAFRKSWIERIDMILKWREEERKFCPDVSKSVSQALDEVIPDYPEAPTSGTELAQNKARLRAEKAWLREFEDPDTWRGLINLGRCLPAGIPQISSPRALYEKACKLQKKRGKLAKQERLRKFHSHRSFDYH